MIYNHSSETMHEVENVALIVTSPPYPMIKKWDKFFGNTDYEKQHLYLGNIWKECYRVLMPGGIMCINIGDATRSIENNFECYPNYACVSLFCKTIGFTPLIPILWKKISNRPNAFLGSGFLPPNAYVSQDCEYISIFRKGRLRKFDLKDKNRIKSSFTKEERDKWFSQIWQIPGKKGAKKDSSFPEEIPYRLIRMFSVIGDLVVDPFSGTGTTMKVALENKRKFVGYEIKERALK